MTLLRRGDYWHYDFIEGGVRHQGSTRRKVRREAERVEALVRRQILELAQFGAQSKACTIREAAEAWLLAVGVRLRDAKNNRSRIRLLLAEGGLPPEAQLSTLTVSMVGQLVDRRLAAGKSGATANREVALVQSIIRHAGSRGFAVLPLQLNGLRNKERSKSRFLSAAEVDRVIQELNPGGDPLRVDQYHLAVLLIDTGARYSELAELQWLDVLDNGSRLRFVQTKTDRPRTVVLGKRAVGIVAERLAARDPRSPYVFPGAKPGQPRGYAVDGIRAAIDRAGCNTPELVNRYGTATVHTFRHTHAAMLLREGVPIQHVSLRLGHASLAMTQRVYGHVQCEDGDSAVLAALGRGIEEPVVDTVNRGSQQVLSGDPRVNL